ncbi:hypothetical protein C8R48DRAFT_674717 [Suillus tomentosus]|nr:hypothetical protein C8R48DRAFT_674717 [Suillus tomentosus]
MSLSFLHSCNVPCFVSNHNGVAVELTSGLTFHPIYLNECNVELGHDWIMFMNARFDGSRILRPLELDLVQLGAGHTWNCQPGDNMSSSSSDIAATQAGCSSSVTQLRRPSLSALAKAHRLSYSKDVMQSVCQQLNMYTKDKDDVLSGRIMFLTAILTNMKRRPLERLSKANGINFKPGSKTG